MTPRRIVFNPPAASIFNDDGTTSYLASNEPTIALEEIVESPHRHARHTAQMAAIGNRALPRDPAAASPLFEQDLSIACREYAVRRLWVDNDHEREQPGETWSPLGNAPPRAVAAQARGAEGLLELLARAPAATPEEHVERLYLFNVIVAFEWLPSPQRLRRMQWAFRRASDYLYDVTNGGMAFGQVILAGPDWLECADIQVLASNRYLPRAWVSGLLEPTKYTPIRVGRGLWVRDRHMTVEWDEPEGYRALVHEWAHYALGLKDAYMRAAQLFEDGNRLRAGANGTKAATQRVVLPERRVKSESIMASVQGNSELENPLPTGGAKDAVLRDVIGKRYRGLNDRLQQPWSGPGNLPLPLPHFRRAGALATGELRHTEHAVVIPFAPQPAETDDAALPQVSLDNDTIPSGRWEVFVVRFEGGEPRRLSYQGELDARAPERGFMLLGAEPGDTLILAGGDGRRYAVWSRRLDKLDDGRLIEWQWDQLQGLPRGEEASAAAVSAEWLKTRLGNLGWRRLAALGHGEGGEADGRPAPADILPLSPEHGGKTRARVRLAGGAGREGATVAVFGIDGMRRQADTTADQGYQLPSLDGYVLHLGRPPSGEGLDAAPMLISDFSQGGPPKTAPNLVSDPIAAGASSGEALLLCDVQDPGLDTDGYRVVTTLLRGAPLPEGTAALSPVFSVATNAPLLTSFTPTLLIVNTYPADEALDTACICRINNGKLEPLPTYMASGGAYAVAPLLPSKSKLVVDKTAPPQPGEPIFERFVLARSPTAAPDGGESAATAE
ncbi:MAG TPA: hypothetical protein PKD53_04240 [Chloroflexaceae bacterium]|nr:hypothetical protein [Chloroflexaceae bacterium]